MMNSDLTPEYSISRIIKGNWQLSTGHSHADASSAPSQVDHLLDYIRSGITTLDFGDIYLGVEELVGEAISRLSVEERNGVQLHTKYVPDAARLSVHTRDDVRSVISRSRNRLGVSSLDLVQFHWWDYNVSGYIDALQYLQELQAENQLRYIGVTNFDTQRMQEIVDSGITPVSTQVQYSLLDRRPEKSLTSFCAQHNIALLCYGTVSGGFLSEKYLNVEEPFPPYENRSLVKYQLIIDEFGGWDLYQKLLRVLKNIADNHSVSIAAIASAFVLTRPQVKGVIVGARNNAYLEEHMAIVDIQLSDSDMDAIESVLDQANTLPGDIYELERTDPKHSEIMHKNNNTS